MGKVSGRISSVSFSRAWIRIFLSDPALYEKNNSVEKDFDRTKFDLMNLEQGERSRCIFDEHDGRSVP